MGSALALLWLGTVPLRGGGVPSVAAQLGACGELAAASCAVTVDESRTARFEDWTDVHEWVGWNPDPDKPTIRVDVSLPEALAEGVLQSQLARESGADTVEVRLLGADRSQLAGGSTSAVNPTLQLGATLGVGLYVVQVRTQQVDSSPSYSLLVSNADAGSQPGPPPPSGGCPATYQVIRGFGLIYHQDARLRSRLGCPQEDERRVWMADQVFQRGLMLWREDDHKIIVLRGENRSTSPAADVYPDKFVEGDPEDEMQSPPPGLVAPVRGFGGLWRSNVDIRQALGFGLAPERGFYGAVQQFDRGVMIWTGTEQPFIWAIYGNGDTLILGDLFRG